LQQAQEGQVHQTDKPLSLVDILFRFVCIKNSSLVSCYFPGELLILIPSSPTPMVTATSIDGLD
jgi:hypothetical protein